MACELKTQLANKNNYGAKRDISSIKYIVVHYTANDGDTDENNAKYFQQDLKANGKNVASSHYFVDDDSITNSVSDDYVSYSVGGNKWNNNGGRLYGVAKNTNTLNIELCDTVKDGVHNISDATLGNSVSFIKQKMAQYNIDIDHVIRHYDVNGKPCPSYYVDETEWAKFKSLLVDNTVKVEVPIVQPQVEVAQTEQPKSYLSKGDKGDEVKTLQTMLNACGYSCGSADGNFGTKTENALVAFQNAYGLTKDGKYGNASKSKLTEIYNTPKGDEWVRRLQSAIVAKVDGIVGSETLSKCPTIKKGSKGTVVALMQERLGNTFGIGVVGGYDGNFGSGTYNAVVEFQRQKGLKQDGVVGQNSWRKLLGL